MPISESLRLIGFSVGASAIWQISEKEELPEVLNATCFYGSQIRNNINVNSKFPIHLIFPKSEEHFSVSELTKEIRDKEKVGVEQTDFLHGFMNTHSQNYDQLGYNQHLQALCNVPSNNCFKWDAFGAH